MNQPESALPAMADTYYITTAIAYPNGRPHIGHAYEAVAAELGRAAARDGAVIEAHGQLVRLGAQLPTYNCGRSRAGAATDRRKHDPVSDQRSVGQAQGD